MFSEDRRLEIVATKATNAAPRRKRVPVERDRATRYRCWIRVIPPLVRVRRRNFDGWYCDERRRAGRRRKAEQPLATTPRNGERRAARKERDVGAEFRGEVKELVSRHCVGGERVDRVQCRGGIARPTA